MTKDTEINLKTQALQEKDVTISTLNDQLKRAKNQLSTKQQVSQLGLRLNFLTSHITF